MVKGWGASSSLGAIQAQGNLMIGHLGNFFVGVVWEDGRLRQTELPL